MKKLTLMRVVLAGLMMIAVCGSLPAQVPYVEPDFSRPLFNRDALSLEGDALDEIVEALAALAGNYPDDPAISNVARMKALAVALRLDGLSAPARQVNDALIDGRAAPVVDGYDDARATGDFVWKKAMELIEEGTEEEDARLAAYLLDVAVSADAGKREKRMKKAEELGGGGARWGAVISLPAEEREKGQRVVEAPIRGEAGRQEGVLTEEGEVKRGLGEAGKERGRDEGTEGRGAEPAPGAVERVEPVEPVAEQAVLELKRTEGSLRVVVFEPAAETMAGEEAVACRLRISVSDGERESPENPFYCEEGIEGPMISQLEVIATLLQQRYPVLPETRRIDFRLTTIEDGRALPIASAHLGAPLFYLLDSLVTGDELDAEVSVGGVVTAEGRILARGSKWRKKVKAAEGGGAKVVVVGKGAEAELTDYLVVGDYLPLLRTQVIEAREVGAIGLVLAKEREAAIAEAMLKFGEVQALEERMEVDALVENAKVLERFQEILELYPQHLSAKLLLKYGMGTVPGEISFRGSVEQIDRRLRAVAKVTKPRGAAVVLSERDNVVSDVLFELRRIRPRLHSAAHDYCDAATDFIEMVRDYFELSSKATPTARQKEEELTQAQEELREMRRKLR